MSIPDRYPFVYPLEVRFRDLDSLAHVNNAVYLTFFEQARIHYAQHLLGNISINDIPFILAEITVTYYRPAFFAEQLLLGVRVNRLGTKSFGMEYALYREDELIALGRSILVWYDHQTNRSVPIPDSFREAVRRVQGALPD